MATIYLHSTAGDDTTGDGSVGNPYKTIAKGITAASNSDVIMCKDEGPYAEGELTFGIKTGLSLVGRDVYDGSGIKTAISASGFNWAIKGFTGATFDSLDISGMSAQGITLTLDKGAAWSAENCIVRGGTVGFIYGKDATFIRNRLIGQTEDGIYLDRNNNTIFSCYISSSYKSAVTNYGGICIDGVVNGNVVENCTIIGHAHGVSMAAASEGNINNCIMYGYSTYGAKAYEDNVFLTNCNIYSSIGGSAVQDGGSPASNIILTTPPFQNAPSSYYLDYRLTDGMNSVSRGGAKIYTGAGSGMDLARVPWKSVPSMGCFQGTYEYYVDGEDAPLKAIQDNYTSNMYTNGYLQRERTRNNAHFSYGPKTPFTLRGRTATYKVTR